jgi:hypothetical protein
MYGVYLILASILLLVYVLWRASSLPRLRRIPRRPFLLASLLLGLLLVSWRLLGHDSVGSWGALLEFISTTLLGTLFLVFTCLFPVDLLSGFGRFWPRRAAQIRSWAMLAGCLLALLALFQGLRPPVVVRYQVRLPGLPPALDGIKLAALSDLHLGTLIGPGWLQARVEQVQALRPDMILLLGDVFEGHGASPAPYLAGLRRLSARLGVWAVEGNHEMHGGPAAAAARRSEPFLRTLRNEVVEPAPGLFLAGRRYLSRREQARAASVWTPGWRQAPGAKILMAHVPVAARLAARTGVGLMLAGHTHGGQIWPLSIASRLLNPLLAGRYEMEGMTVLVSRGAGTWGPRMRLWRPGEIMLITLRSLRSQPRPPAEPERNRRD